MKRPLLTALVALLTLAAAAQEPKDTYSYAFLSAVAKLNAGDTIAAAHLLGHADSIRPNAPEVCFYLAKCRPDEDGDSLRHALIAKAAALDPENVTYKEALIPVLVGQDDIPAAARLAEDIVKAQPERTEMLDVLAQMYQYMKQWPALLSVLDRIETQEGPSQQLALRRMQVYNTMGEGKKAERALRQLVADDPLNLSFRVILGNYLMQHDKKKEALAQYRTVLDEEPDNPDALLSLMDYYRSEGQEALALSVRDRMLLSPKADTDTKLLVVKQAIRANEQAAADSTEILRLLDRLLADPQADIAFHEMKLAYMQMKKMPEDSLRTVLTTILDRRPEHAAARFQLIQMAWGKGDAEEMVRLAAPAEQYNPEEWAFSYFLGVGLFLSEKKEACVKALERAAAHVDEKKERNLAVEMYSLLGDALHATGRAREAYQAYDNCLRLDPDKHACLNNYAYYLSEESRDLDRAAAMSLRTIKAEPNNATYLDTYAWILYLQGRYTEAKIYIDMAVKNLDPKEDNHVVLGHQKAIAERAGH